MKKMILFFCSLMLLGCERTKIPVTTNRPSEPFSGKQGTVFYRRGFGSFSPEVNYRLYLFQPINGTDIELFDIYIMRNDDFRIETVEREKGRDNVRDAFDDSYNPWNPKPKDSVRIKTFKFQYLGDTPFFHSQDIYKVNADDDVIGNYGHENLELFYFDKQDNIQSIELSRLLLVFDAGIQDSKVVGKGIVKNSTNEYTRKKFKTFVKTFPTKISKIDGVEGHGPYTYFDLSKVSDYLMSDNEKMEAFMNIPSNLVDEVSLSGWVTNREDVAEYHFIPYDHETFGDLRNRLVGDWVIE